MTIRTDYDKIAVQYDEDRKGRAYGPDWFVKRSLDEGNTGLAVLDLGCGPGRWLAAQLKHFPDRPVRWVGLDPFAGMLALARTNAPGAELVRAGAERIPFPDSAFDLVRSSVSFHHFADKERALDEIVRVLRPGGCFELGNIDPWTMPGWWVYRFFPETRGIDLEDFWPVDRLVAGLRARGMSFESYKPPSPAPGRTQANVRDLLSGAERRTLSQLAALDDVAYARGLAGLRAFAAEDPSRTVEDEFTFYGLVAMKA